MRRRSFLKRSLVVGIAASGGAAFLATRENRELPAPTGELFVLDEISFGVLALFAARILPIGPADPVKIAHDIDASLRFTSPEAQADMRMVLGVLENALSGVFTRYSATLFSELDDEGRDFAIRRWGSSPVSMLRGATASLRKLCVGVFYAPLDHAMAIGYKGPPFEKPAPPPIEARKPLSPPYVRKVAGAAEALGGTRTATTADGADR